MTVSAEANPLVTVADEPVYKSPYGEDFLYVTTVEGAAGRLASISVDGRALVPAHNRPLAAAALAGATAIVAPDTPQLDATVRRAIADPGKWTPRQKDQDGDYEPLPQWQTRAVLTALRKPPGSGQ